MTHLWEKDKYTAFKSLCHFLVGFVFFIYTDTHIIMCYSAVYTYLYPLDTRTAIIRFLSAMAEEEAQLEGDLESQLAEQRESLVAVEEALVVEEGEELREVSC